MGTVESISEDSDSVLFVSEKVLLEEFNSTEKIQQKVIFRICLTRQENE